MSHIIDNVIREILFEDFETAKEIAAKHGCRLTDYDPVTGDLTIEHRYDAVRVKGTKKVLQEAAA